MICGNQTKASLLIFLLCAAHIKQLLDEVEHDIMNYQKTEVCVICRSRRLRQITQTRGFDNS